MAAIAYLEAVRRLPASFEAALVPEPANRYNPNAVAIYADAAKIGYLPPEVARHYFAGLVARHKQGLETRCAARVVGRTREDLRHVEIDLTELEDLQSA